MRISSKYTTTNFPKNSLRTWCMSLMNVLGALVKPKGMTNHSYNPNLVLKEFFHSSPSLILIWLYPLFKFILENMVAPCNSSIKSSNLGIGCLYLMIMLLIAQQYMHILHVPSFLGTRITGIAQGLMLCCTYPFSNNSFTCFWISLASSRLVL